MKEKIESYLGFARRSGNLLSGYNTCIHGIQRGKIHLMILAEDISEQTSKKFLNLCSEMAVPCKVYGTSGELSRITGTDNRGVFGITDRNFARVIQQEIDQKLDQKKEVR